MEKIKKIQPSNDLEGNRDFFGRYWEGSWTYVKTIVDVLREPVLILDKNLCVMAANESFYRTFQVERSETENKIVYKLGNGQWDIPSLRKLLENILPKNTFFKGFEVNHDFLNIGPKSMLLNARQIHFKDDAHLGQFPQIILLAFEDVTDMMAVAESIAKHSNILETELGTRTSQLEGQMVKLRKEMDVLKKAKK